MKILIGGCSCAGKTTLAERLSDRFSIVHVRLDDIRRTLSDPVFDSMKSETIWERPCAERLAILQSMGAALRSSIVEWVDKTSAGILEGEGIEPGNCASLAHAEDIRVLFVVENDPLVLQRTLTEKCPRYGRLPRSAQMRVAEMNAAYSDYILSEARRLSMLCLPSQPWLTLEERSLEALELAHDNTLQRTQPRGTAAP